MRSAPHPLPRVLCLTLRTGSVGHVVLDGFGVAEGSFFTSRLDHLSPSARFRALIRLVRESCRRFHPTRVVFGLPGPHREDRLALAKRLMHHLAKIRVVLSVKRLRDAARLLVERLRYTMADEIVDRLAKHFVPALAPFVERTRARPRYWRTAWYALAIALAALVEYHPCDAAALAQPSAFEIAPFCASLAASLRHLPPDTV